MASPRSVVPLPLLLLLLVLVPGRLADGLANDTAPDILPPPPPLTLTRLNLTAIRVEWTAVTSVPVLHYVIAYRQSAGNASWSSTTVPGGASGTLSIDLAGLQPESEYGFRAWSVSADGRSGPASSISTVSTGSILRFLPLSTTAGVTTGLVEDSLSRPIEINITGGLPFGPELHKVAYIGVNGFVSFGHRPNGSQPAPFPGTHTHLLAPFWTNLTVSEEAGRVSYEVHTAGNGGELLPAVSTYLSDYGEGEFLGVWLLAVEWRDMAQLNNLSNFTNTFQLVVITDGIVSYALFIYRCDLIKWGEDAVIGYTADENFYQNHPWSFTERAVDIDCMNQTETDWSSVVFRIAEGSPPPPPSLTLTRLNLTAMRVEWTAVTSVPVLHYVIAYRQSARNASWSNTTVPGGASGTLSIDLAGLEMETEYDIIGWSISIYGGRRGPSSEIQSLSTPLILRFLSLNVSAEVAGFVEKTDDALSQPVSIRGGLPFGYKVHDVVYVSTDGYASFSEEVVDWKTRRFPIANRSMVSPFWADTNIKADTGTVTYQVHTNQSADGHLSTVSRFLNDQGESRDFSGTWLLVAEWRDVPPNPTSATTNTFQLVVITDGIVSYALFIYRCDLIKWGEDAVIGYTADESFYQNHPWSFTERAVDIDCMKQTETDWSHVVYNLTEEYDIVDECELGLHNCSEKAVCEDTRLGYTCRCWDMFEGDGFNCRVVDPTGAPENGSLHTVLGAAIGAAMLMLVLLLVTAFVKIWRKRATAKQGELSCEPVAVGGGHRSTRTATPSEAMEGETRMAQSSAGADEQRYESIQRYERVWNLYESVKTYETIGDCYDHIQTYETIPCTQ